jgi:uncharacterized protein YdaU (DUF1376 family)
MPQDDRPPAFLFYVNDFASDGVVEAMSTEGVGAYILLLCKAWREEQPGTLPTDDSVLARWARLTPDRWSEVKSAVLAAFSSGRDNRLHQKRMESEYRKLVEQQARKRSNSQNAARERWKRTYMQPHSDGNPNAIPIKDIESEIENLFEEFWTAFPKGRKKSKGSALESFFKAAKKAEPRSIIEAATAYAASDEGRGAYVKMPSTWLNQECWNDDREAWRDKDKPAGETSYRQVTSEQFAEYLRLQRFKEKPQRHSSNPNWFFGTLRDGTKVECKEFKK